jgi:hypothetical protein
MGVVLCSPPTPGISPFLIVDQNYSDVTGLMLKKGRDSEGCHPTLSALHTSKRIENRDPRQHPSE